MRAQAPYLAPGAQAAVEFRFASLQLGTGTYSVTIALHTGDSHVASNYDWWDRALVFRIVADESVPTFIGVARMEVTANWTGGALPS
jgi:lipopolysaccharide transport system ATP-binding protein